MIERARKLLADEWRRHDTSSACEHTAAVVAMLRAGRFDESIELGAIRTAIEEGLRGPLAPADRLDRARRLLASAYDWSGGESGLSMVSRVAAKAVRSGAWDKEPLLLAIARALGGADA
jgi:hypothetical protein